MNQRIRADLVDPLFFPALPTSARPPVFERIQMASILAERASAHLPWVMS
jgi:hypothetical protein